MTAAKAQASVPYYSGEWTARMRMMRVGDSFTFDARNYATINGIRQRMKRKLEGLRFDIRLGARMCTRVA